jgi:hypothetical protein
MDQNGESSSATTSMTTTTMKWPPLYILAHSAAGGYLVRFLMKLMETNKGPVEDTAKHHQTKPTADKATNNLTWSIFNKTQPPPQQQQEESSSSNLLLQLQQQQKQNHRYNQAISFLSKIRAVVFTDSTHNLQWTISAQNDILTQFLQSPTTCLCIRNNTSKATGYGGKLDEATSTVCAPGTSATRDCDHWWTHRFGTLPTVWAGTTNHSAMCHVARHVIWDFYDSRSSSTTTTNSSHGGSSKGGGGSRHSPTSSLKNGGGGGGQVMSIEQPPSVLPSPP